MRRLFGVLAAVLVVAGCTVDGEPHAASSGEGSVTFEDLLSAPVPELCGHEPGRLANGVLPLQDPRRGPAGMSYAPKGFPHEGDPQVAYGDLTGDGVADAAMVTTCTAGGVGWPPVVNLYTKSDTRLGSIDLADLAGGGGRGAVHSIAISGGRVHLTWMGYGDGDSGCCPTKKMAGELRWTGSSVVAENVRASS